jgi:excisionase family DNA binding protein
MESQDTAATDVTGPPNDLQGELLTKKELAARLKVATRTLENWQSRGILGCIRVGKVVRFHWPDVVRNLKTNFGVHRRG